MSGTITTVDGLIGAGLMSGEDAAEARAVAARYAIAVTPEMVNLIERADDPIGLQFLPRGEELIAHPDERIDPIGDHSHSPVDGIVHRYPDRVLLKALHVCPVYCRFCFRREMVGPDGDGLLAGDRLDAAVAYIANHAEIFEVIVTGGDPLMLSPRRMRDLLVRLGAVPHVKVIRFHTRVPVVDPDRIDTDLVDALLSSGKAIYIAIHANHPREFTASAQSAIRRLADAGIVLLSQSVLLKGINDDADVLAALMRLFVQNRIRPYYLHHPDLAPGTAHFRLSISEGRRITEALKGRLSGLCQPAYVLDIPGGFGKTDLAAAWVEPSDDGSWQVRDFNGRVHTYRD